jgi:VCBS repeat-containing protein
VQTSTGEDGIELTFGGASDSGGSGVNQYLVKRSTDTGGPYSQVGTVTDYGSSSYTFTDVPSSSGRYYYVVSAVDAAGNEGPNSNEASALTNQPPTASDDTRSTDEDTAIDSNTDTNVDGLLANDSDPNGDDLSLASVAGTSVSGETTVPLSSGATLTVTEDGNFIYDPSGSFDALASGDSDSDTFSYVVEDPFGATDNAQVTVTINGVNDPPVATDDNASTDEDTAIDSQADGLASLLANDDDVDDAASALTVAQVQGEAISSETGSATVELASGATVTVNEDGSYVYDPSGQFDDLAPSENATDAFSYVPTDGEDQGSAGTVTLTISGVNDAPVVQTNEVLAVSSSGERSFITTTRLSASDPDDTATDITFTATDGPSNGTLEVNGSSVSSFTQQQLQDGVVAYQHDGSAATTDAVTFSLSNPDDNASTTATFDIVIGQSNDPPSASNDQETTTEDNPLSVGASNGVLANDSDPNDDPLTVSAVNGTAQNVGNQFTLPSGALLTLNADGSYTYDPNSAFDGLAAGEDQSDSFSYSVQDGQGGVAQATVTITVTGENDAPTVTTNERVTITAGETVTLTVLDLNAADPDDAASSLTYSVTSGPSNGSIEVGDAAANSFTQQDLQSGAVTYVAQTAGDDSFTFDLTDDDGAGPTGQTFNVTVQPANQPPTTSDDTYTISEDGKLDVTTRGNGVLGNDSDPDGNDADLQAFIDQQPEQGELTLNRDGTFTYTPPPDSNGTYTFQYVASDANGATATGMATITVEPANDAPTLASNEGVSVAAGGQRTLEGTVLRATDVDDDDGPAALTYTVSGGLSQGELLVDGASSTSFTQQEVNDGLVDYNHTAGETSDTDDSFTFNVSDDEGASLSEGEQTFSITVQVGNRPPTADDDSYSVDEDNTLEVTDATAEPDLLENDSDPDNDNLQAFINQPPENGSLTLNRDGTFTYTPNADFSGTDTFSYEISDGNGAADQATVTITVNPINDPPTLAANAGLTLQEGEQAPIASQALQATDVDDEPTALTYTVTSGPSQGELLVDGSAASSFTQQEVNDGLVVYNHTADAADNDSFTFDLTDEEGAGPTGQTFSITVEPDNRAPVTTDDAYSVDEDTPLSVTDPANGVLDNDTDPDDNDLLAFPDQQPDHGEVSLSRDGTFTYTPNPNYNGPDSFQYVASDAEGGTAPGTVNITVNAVNDPPTLAANGGLTVGAGTERTIGTATLQATDIDEADGPSQLTYTLETAPAQGELRVDGSAVQAGGTFTQQQIDDGQVVYNHTAGPADGTNDSFAFTVADDDGAGLGGQQTFDITVQVGNLPPTAEDDSYSVDEDNTLEVTDATPDLLANDSDPNDNPLEVTGNTSPSNGSLLARGADGTFEYQPDEDFNGTDSFTYTVSDGNGATDRATVTITVNSINDAPTLDANTGLTVDAEGQGTISDQALRASDVDDVPSALTYTVTDGPSRGQVQVDGSAASRFTQQQVNDGLVTYTHTESDGTDDSFTFDLTDDDGAGPTGQTFSITVRFDNAAPTATDDRYLTSEGQPLAVNDPAQGLLANDSDPDDDPLTPSIVDSTANGTITTLNANGTFRYEPDDGYNGPDAFTYQVSDGNETAEATVSITVRQAQTDINVTRTFPNPGEQTSFRLVALPGQSDTPLPETVNGQEGTDWRAFREDGATDEQAYSRRSCGSASCDFGPGTGYWLIAQEPWSVNGTDVTTVSLDTTSAGLVYTIPLQQGWNIISNPLEENVSWSTVQEASGTSQPLYRWRGGTWQTTQTFASATDGEAYYFMAMDDQVDSLVVPYPDFAQSTANGEAQSGLVAQQAASPRASTLTLHVMHEGDTLSTVRAGLRSNAEVGLDRTDRFGPPAYFGPASLRLIQSRDQRRYTLAAEYQPPAQDGRAFDLELQAAPDTALTIAVEKTGSFQRDRVRLVRQSSGQPFDLRSSDQVTFLPRAKTTHLRLLIGSDRYVEEATREITPSAVKLMPNYPNPFRQATTLEYALPERQDVRLEVYNVLGRRVRVLAQGAKPAGFHRVQWRGRDDGGTPVASGVYLVRLQAGSTTKVERVVVVR